MAFELKEGSWTMFRNKDKKEETHADYQGEIKINGQVYWINGWLKESQKTGERFMSGTVKAKTQKAADNAPKKRDEDIPF